MKRIRALVLLLITSGGCFAMDDRACATGNVGNPMTALEQAELDFLRLRELYLTHKMLCRIGADTDTSDRRGREAAEKVEKFKRVVEADFFQRLAGCTSEDSD